MRPIVCAIWPCKHQTFPMTSAGSRTRQSTRRSKRSVTAADGERTPLRPAPRSAFPHSARPTRHGLRYIGSRLGAAVTLYRMRRAGCRFRGERGEAVSNRRGQHPRRDALGPCPREAGRSTHLPRASVANAHKEPNRFAAQPVLARRAFFRCSLHAKRYIDCPQRCVVVSASRDLHRNRLALG
jgi:hypothetical protein